MPRALGRGRGRAPKREENWVVLHRDSPGGERGVGGRREESQKGMEGAAVLGASLP